MFFVARFSVHLVVNTAWCFVARISRTARGLIGYLEVTWHRPIDVTGLQVNYLNEITLFQNSQQVCLLVVRQSAEYEYCRVFAWLSIIIYKLKSTSDSGSSLIHLFWFVVTLKYFILTDSKVKTTNRIKTIYEGKVLSPKYIVCELISLTVGKS